MINLSEHKRYSDTPALQAVASLVTEPLDRLDATSVPRKVAGSIGAVVAAIFKTVPGAIQGMARSTRINQSSQPDKPSTGIYTATTAAEIMAVGAGLGTIAGPLGTVVGLGAGFVGAVVVRVAESKARLATDFVRNVDTTVDSHLATGTDTPRAGLHNLMEGTKVGAQAGWSQGLNQGWEAGVGLIDALTKGW